MIKKKNENSINVKLNITFVCIEYAVRSRTEPTQPTASVLSHSVPTPPSQHQQQHPSQQQHVVTVNQQHQSQQQSVQSQSQSQQVVVAAQQQLQQQQQQQVLGGQHLQDGSLGSQPFKKIRLQEPKEMPPLRIDTRVGIFYLFNCRNCKK